MAGLGWTRLGCNVAQGEGHQVGGGWHVTGRQSCLQRGQQLNGPPREEGKGAPQGEAHEGGGGEGSPDHLAEEGTRGSLRRRWIL